ncbi:Putative protein [Zobellia galactanivorans]|uniref:Uncharacterized protein n=1 Tax=Zobellia galactanivorans (strain DSM 12802 / CCUG 47099 / CIP 106680 / NCIMB 13871 / Dsij) TaxID=63186 RepID=G0LA26_ZOBGA|nr:Putative protein [Zobellia galactanivorans]
MHDREIRSGNHFGPIVDSIFRGLLSKRRSKFFLLSPISYKFPWLKILCSYFLCFRGQRLIPSIIRKFFSKRL